MTAPDPGLTDLIAAEIKTFLINRSWGISTSETEVSAFGNGQINVTELADVLTLVVEQHTNGRMAELQDQLDALSESQPRKTAAVKRLVGAGARLLRIERDDARQHAEKAEATIARVEKLQGDLFQQGGNLIAQWGAARLIRAALEGEA